MLTKRKKIKIAVSLGLNLLLLLATLLIASHLRGLLLSQEAAEVWRGQSEERFAQITCLLAQSEALSEDSVYTFRQSLEAKLTEASLEAPENGSLWTDCYSAAGSLTVSSSRASSEANAVGVGGDFFLFHPLRLLAGGYFDSENVMDDLVVIDRELAWKLFGSNDVCGMTVTIDKYTYIIVGVGEREEDFASKAAYPGGAGIYMSFSALIKHLPSAGVTCYEIVLPDPVTGFALDTVEGGFSSAELLQNTGRFDFSKTFELVGQFGKRSMQQSGVIYPYWENAARLVEDYLALLAVLTLALCIYPLIAIVYLLVLFFRYLRRRAKDLRLAAESYSEKRRTRGYVPVDSELPPYDPLSLPPGDDAQSDIEFDVASIVREVLEENETHIDENV